ncbi:hypothetical protein V495_07671 [Pseudogymnoascus sp. VKM F-4514 (FW-929)]|nr:hypothetical protein V495_07671 [Pseudogymnoascus sp. VKM F-4514 (FW-929)]KFY58547.1 hypothetical protein V497_04787 [Pseudogymnoascus sp. VKM F-4516 (FW-969)]
MIMFPNGDPSPKEKEEEIRWSIEGLQKSLEKDSCYFRKVTDSSGCYAGFAIWTLDPSSTETGHKTKSTLKRESWNPASLDVRAWMEVSKRLRDERQRALYGQHNIWRLNTISVAPGHQSKGVGSMLLQWGCDKADSCGWNSFVMASPDGVPLYSKFDFKAVGQVQTKHGVFTIRAGDLQGVQNTFSDWLEDDPTNVLKISSFYLCIEDAVQCDQYEILTYLLSQGILLDILDVAMAVCHKKRRALEIYLAHGWNINDPRTDLQPPLLSIGIRDEKMALWFLDHGADPNAECDYDYTPLSVAMVKASFATIKLLFDRGGSVEHGQLLHHVAVRQKPDRIKILNFILKKGAPGMNRLLHQHRHANYLSLESAGLDTPLGMAARVGALDIAQHLLKHGADPTIRNSLGDLPIDTAEYHNNLDMVALLSEYSATSSNH